MRLLLKCTMLVAVSSTVLMAQDRTSGSTSAEGEKPAPAVTAADIQALRDALAAQQKQIQELQRALAQRGESAQAAQQATPAVPAASESAQPAAASQP
jgi:phage-related tail fiber protein